jgi:hypothetical protein
MRNLKHLLAVELRARQQKKAEEPEPPEGPGVATQAFFHSKSEQYDRARLLLAASADPSAKNCSGFWDCPTGHRLIAPLFRVIDGAV